MTKSESDTGLHVEVGSDLDTNPAKADTDDDGYWHGWIGVRGYETRSARRRRKP